MRTFVLLAVTAALAAPPAHALILLSMDEALALVFPGAVIERGTVYLGSGQLARAEELAGEKPRAAVVHPYQARRDGLPVGTAYFDSHIVRTLSETVMVAVDTEGRVLRVEVLSFDEPPEYLPREPWYRQFEGRPLDADLELRRAIRPVSGATITARATTDAVRRVLALHRTLAESASPRSEGP